jgi:hypothetical protein
MALSFRSAAFFTLTSALLLGLLSPACSQQGEGERCDNLRAGDSDCDSGLECVQADDLLEKLTDRCCKPDGSYEDSRCTPNTGLVNTGGKGGSSTMTDAGAAGEAVSGAPATGGVSGGGAPTEVPIDQGGQAGAAGTPATSDAGAPSNTGGVPSTPAGGQGGAG